VAEWIESRTDDTDRAAKVEVVKAAYSDDPNWAETVWPDIVARIGEDRADELIGFWVDALEHAEERKRIGKLVTLSVDDFSEG
jgi:hypothetical protein